MSTKKRLQGSKKFTQHVESAEDRRANRRAAEILRKAKRMSLDDTDELPFSEQRFRKHKDLE